ncbi:MAG: hypothetical protein HMLKMBBP_00993 [Planctomycetes bacterium]|nr:hypothetical protein [Planctomycetota bacterium]
MLAAARPLVPADRNEVQSFLAHGGPADAYLLDQLHGGGIADFFGAYEFGSLVGVSVFRRGAISCSARTSGEAVPALVHEMTARGAWGSVVGPDPPCGAVVDMLRGREALRVDRPQRFFAARRGDPLGPGEPRLRPATEADLERLVPLVHAYRVEDGLARRSDPIGAWIREHTAERIRQRHLYVVEHGPEIVFTAAFNFAGPFGAGLGGIYTAPSARGRGLASRGTAEMCRIALSRGSVVTLHVNVTNAPAIAAYRRAGLRPAGMFRLTFR